VATTTSWILNLLVILAITLGNTLTVLAAENVLYIEGNVNVVNDAIFIAYDPDDASGTGIFTPFVQVKAANQDMV
jgi:hypothetical protein